jgi:molybdopterin-guanine dinucleotide biosynthesis protein A
MTTHSAHPRTVGVLLAGGAAKRLGGGDKGLRAIAGTTLLARTVNRVAPQCDDLLLSANGDAARFAAFGILVLPDEVAGNPGPLGGILAALDHLAARADAEWLLSVPVDCPFLPSDLVERLHEARGETKIVVVRSDEQIHPVIALWHVSLRADLYHALVGEDVRKAGAFVARHPHAIVDWPVTGVDPFFNVNTPDDLVEAERFVARGVT